MKNWKDDDYILVKLYIILGILFCIVMGLTIWAIISGEWNVWQGVIGISASILVSAIGLGIVQLLKNKLKFNVLVCSLIALLLYNGANIFLMYYFGDVYEIIFWIFSIFLLIEEIGFIRYLDNRCHEFFEGCTVVLLAGTIAALVCGYIYF